MKCCCGHPLHFPSFLKITNIRIQSPEIDCKGEPSDGDHWLSWNKLLASSRTPCIGNCIPDEHHVLQFLTLAVAMHCNRLNHSPLVVFTNTSARTKSPRYYLMQLRDLAVKHVRDLRTLFISQRSPELVSRTAFLAQSNLLVMNLNLSSAA